MGDFNPNGFRVQSLTYEDIAVLLQTTIEVWPVGMKCCALSNATV